jgi:16S rRNA G527 N7-methylase RsmG
MTFREELSAAARASRRPLDAATLEACARHFDLLLRWNQTHNLTRIVAAPEAARKHYLDCLVPLLDARDAGLLPAAFVDVGSGAGFPGLLGCVCWPGAQATLVEPAQKRASFLMLAAQAMGARMTVVSSAAGAAAAAGPQSRTNAAQSAPRVVLSRATFSPGKRSELTLAGGDAIAVWGHAHDSATWKSEVATWGGWQVGQQPYAVDGLEPRVLLWAWRGEFHVKHLHPIP